MQEIHSDTQLGPWPALRTPLASTHGPVRPAGLRDRLLGWDGRMDADSHDAGAFAAWRAALVRGSRPMTPWRALARPPTVFPPCSAPWTAPPAPASASPSKRPDAGAAPRRRRLPGPPRRRRRRRPPARDAAGLGAAPHVVAPRARALRSAQRRRFRHRAVRRQRLRPVHREPPRDRRTARSAGPSPATSGTSPTGTTAAGWFRSAPQGVPATTTISPPAAPVGSRRPDPRRHRLEPAHQGEP